MLHLNVASSKTETPPKAEQKPVLFEYVPKKHLTHKDAPENSCPMSVEKYALNARTDK